MVNLPSPNIIKFCTFAAETKKSTTMEGLRSISILDDEPLIIAALKHDLANYYNLLCVWPRPYLIFF